MKRVLIIGCPGSGKSIFARALHAATDLPLTYLDMLYWNADRTTVSSEVFLSRLQDVLQQEKWIIDGNYASSLPLRLDACDTVFFLDYPVELCLDGIRNRMGTARPDIPWIEMEEDPEFVEFVRSFSETTRPTILHLLQERNLNIHVFHSREEAERFLQSL